MLVAVPFILRISVVHGHRMDKWWTQNIKEGRDQNNYSQRLTNSYAADINFSWLSSSLFYSLINMLITEHLCLPLIWCFDQKYVSSIDLY
jgi:hypothetical protein